MKGIMGAMETSKEASTEPPEDWIKTDRDIVVFDLETTGVNPEEDKIIQLAATKHRAEDGVEIARIDQLLNPGKEIPETVVELTGITNEMVKDKPRFEDKADIFFSFFEDCHIAGFNIVVFDVKFLSMEFEAVEVGFPFPGMKLIDVCNVYRYKFPRDLQSACMDYLGKQVSEEDAHDAFVDTTNTLEVMKEQFRRHKDVGKDIAEWHSYSTGNVADPHGKLGYSADGDLIFLFSKNKGNKVVDHPGMVDWMEQKGFPQSTLKIAKAEIANSKGNQ